MGIHATKNANRFEALEPIRQGVRAAYGVISIHNMPLLDAIAQRGLIRFVPARGEAGACNMADADARVSGGLGVCITSTGTGCGNAAGAMVEAQTAGTPLLHLTGQIESGYLDRDLAYIHEARDQLGMLASVSKAAFRVRSAETAVGTVRQAIALARTAPTGPVSVEIPIDIQQARIPVPAALAPLAVPVAEPDVAALDELARRLVAARRPLLWLGGGARHAGAAARRLLVVEASGVGARGACQWIKGLAAAGAGSLEVAVSGARDRADATALFASLSDYTARHVGLPLVWRGELERDGLAEAMSTPLGARHPAEGVQAFVRRLRAWSAQASAAG